MANLHKHMAAHGQQACCHLSSSQGPPLTLPFANRAKETLPDVQAAPLLLKAQNGTVCQIIRASDNPTALSQHVHSSFGVLGRLAPPVIQEKRTRTCLAMFCQAHARQAHMTSVGMQIPPLKPNAVACWLEPVACRLVGPKPQGQDHLGPKPQGKTL